MIYPVGLKNQGPMLQSQFSIIFGENIGAFLKNQCYDQIFAKFSFVLSKKRQFLPFLAN
jgi:hypothetical protein